MSRSLRAHKQVPTLDALTLHAADQGENEVEVRSIETIYVLDTTSVLPVCFPHCLPTASGKGRWIEKGKAEFYRLQESLSDYWTRGKPDRSSFSVNTPVGPVGVQIRFDSPFVSEMPVREQDRCPVWHLAGVRCAREKGHEGEHALKTWMGGPETDPRCVHKWPPEGWPYGAGCSECAEDVLEEAIEDLP